MTSSRVSKKYCTLESLNTLMFFTILYFCVKINFLYQSWSIKALGSDFSQKLDVLMGVKYIYINFLEQQIDHFY